VSRATAPQSRLWRLRYLRLNAMHLEPRVGILQKGVGVCYSAVVVDAERPLHPLWECAHDHATREEAITCGGDWIGARYSLSNREAVSDDEAICAKCGTPFDDNDQFCAQCGTARNRNRRGTVQRELTSVSTSRDAVGRKMRSDGSSWQVDFDRSPVPAAPAGSTATPGTSIASLVLGIASFVAWLLPLAGYPVSIVGLVLGITGRRRLRTGIGTAGLVCSSIGLALTLANSSAGAYQYLSGHSLFQPQSASQVSTVPSPSPSPGRAAFTVAGSQWSGDCSAQGSCPVSATVINRGTAAGTGVVDFYALKASATSYFPSSLPTIYLAECTNAVPMTETGASVLITCVLSSADLSSWFGGGHNAYLYVYVFPYCNYVGSNINNLQCT
jgi:hypothetical protein